MIETSQHVWTTSTSVLPFSKQKSCGFFLMFRWNFLGFSLCLLPPALAVVTTETTEAPPPSLPASHFKIYLNTLIRSLLSLLFLRLKSHSSLSFSSQSRCYLIILVAFCWTHSSIYLLLGSPAVGTVLRTCFVFSISVFVYVNFTNSMKEINFHLMKCHF